jgi:hypothetical protein
MSIKFGSNSCEDSVHAEPLRIENGVRTLIRRRPSPQQGRALELLGHAVEYLVDSQLYLAETDLNDQLAVQTLMRLNREVFAECAEVVPMRRRLTRRLRRWMGLVGWNDGVFSGVERSGARVRGGDAL